MVIMNIGVAAGIWVITIFGIMLITVTLVNGYKKLKI